MITSNINQSANFIIISSQDSVHLIDPKTSSVLQTYKIPSKQPLITTANSQYGYVLIASPDKNFVTAYDFKGAELWKQNLGGQSQLIHLTNHQDIVIGFFKNKEVRLWSPLWEKKTELSIQSSQIDIVRHQENYILIADNQTLSVYVFLLENIMIASNDQKNNLASYFRKYGGHTDVINDINFGISHSQSIFTVGMDKRYFGWNFNTDITKPYLQGLIESDPNCIITDKNEDFLYIGCANGIINQIKINHQNQIMRSFSYKRTDADLEFRVDRDNQNKKQLIGHSCAISTLQFLIQEGNGILLSGSIDGQIIFWDIFGINNQDFKPTIIKKLTSLTARQIKEILIIERPREYRQEKEEMGFLKFKRQINIRPLKKSDLDENKGYNLIVSNKKKILKSLKSELKNQIISQKSFLDVLQCSNLNGGGNDYSINDTQINNQIEQLIAENRKLKIMNIMLFNKTEQIQ